MHQGWQRLLLNQRNAIAKLERDLAGAQNLAPASELVMAAFQTDPALVKVVILGQDPYPAPGVAIGHAFAVRPSTPLPASLKNIASELRTDVAAELGSADLAAWRRQGILLLNSCLTTLHGKPAAHAKIGWQSVTRAALKALIESQQPLVLVLWGKPAQAVANTLESTLQAHTETVRVVRGVHPSPLSAYRGFFGSKPFSAVNQGLVELGQGVIDWNSNAT